MSEKWHWIDGGDRLIRVREQAPGVPATQEHFPFEDDWMTNRRADLCAYLNRLEALAEALDEAERALSNYMAAFGQALEANDIPYGMDQVRADTDARAVLDRIAALKGKEE